jgi:hypothetical protein
MKTRNLFTYAVIAFAFIATSCDDKNSGDDNGGFSPIPVEQHKTNIEDAGFEMLDEMKDMENEPAIQTNINLVRLLDTSDPITARANTKIHPSKSLVFTSVYATANYKETGIKGLVKTIMVNPAEDPDTFQEIYDELVGVYEWNPEYEEWSYTQTGNKIVLKFPSEENGTTNNASYTVSYTGYFGTNPINPEDYAGDLPQNVSAFLAVDGTEISAYLLDIVYNSEGYPTSIETSLSMGEYVWSAKVSNANNVAFDTELAFTNGSKILLKFTLDAAGNWSKDNIDANYSEETKYYYGYYDEETWMYVEVEVGENDNWTYYETESEFDIHKVVTKGNASFQVMNLKVVGKIDAENLGEKLKEIDATYDWETQGESAVEEQIKVVNEYVNLSLRYADSDDIIALVEAYPVSEEYTWENWVYNEATQEYDKIEVTETDYWMDLRFVFADDSRVDFETYFDDTFSDLIDSVGEWADELENTYRK